MWCFGLFLTSSQRFTYLWTAKSLFYFWRDRQQLLNRCACIFLCGGSCDFLFRNSSLASWTPCLMNIQDPANVAFGDGYLQDALQILRKLVDAFGRWMCCFLLFVLALNFSSKVVCLVNVWLLQQASLFIRKVFFVIAVGCSNDF